MRPHVMIVDDTQDQLHLMNIIFNMVDSSLKIITASGGDEALKKLRSMPQNAPRVILLDLRMPGKSGQEVLAEIKADPLLKKIPVCMFSNGDLQRDICECYENGASFYFTKPSGVEELKAFINSFNTIWFKLASLCD